LIILNLTPDVCVNQQGGNKAYDLVYFRIPFCLKGDQQHVDLLDGGI